MYQGTRIEIMIWIVLVGLDIWHLGKKSLFFSSHEDIILNICLRSHDKQIGSFDLFGVQLEKQRVIYERSDWICVVVVLEQLIHKSQGQSLDIKEIIYLRFWFTPNIFTHIRSLSKVSRSVQTFEQANL